MDMTTAGPVTAEQLERWPDRDARLELVAGVVRHMSPAGPRHGSVNSRLMGALAAHVYPRRLGELFTPDTGFVLRRDPDTVRCPDVAFIAAGRLPPDGLRGRGFSGLAPDLAVETLSPDDRPREMAEKVAEYLDVGVRLVWVIDPKRRTVTVHEPGVAIRTLREDGELDGGRVLPDFRCAVASLFEGIARE